MKVSVLLHVLKLWPLNWLNWIERPSESSSDSGIEPFMKGEVTDVVTAVAVAVLAIILAFISLLL